MAAKDYEIVCGLSSAYFAKTKKTKSNKMSEDRRPITEGEIMMLIDFALDKDFYKEGKDECGFTFDSLINEGYTVEVSLKKKRKNLNLYFYKNNKLWHLTKLLSKISTNR